MNGADREASLSPLPALGSESTVDHRYLRENTVEIISPSLSCDIKDGFGQL